MQGVGCGVCRGGSKSPRARTVRPIMNAVVEAGVKKQLGGLPAVAEILRRLDVAGVVDGLCPIRSDCDLTHGQVVEVLIANRLASPMPLQRVHGCASAWAVEEVFGIEAELLNDDRLARALDATVWSGSGTCAGGGPRCPPRASAGRSACLASPLPCAARCSARSKAMRRVPTRRYAGSGGRPSSAPAHWGWTLS